MDLTPFARPTRQRAKFGVDRREFRNCRRPIPVRRQRSYLAIDYGVSANSRCLDGSVDDAPVIDFFPSLGTGPTETFNTVFKGPGHKFRGGTNLHLQKHEVVGSSLDRHSFFREPPISANGNFFGRVGDAFICKLNSRIHHVRKLPFRIQKRPAFCDSADMRKRCFQSGIIDPVAGLTAKT